MNNTIKLTDRKQTISPLQKNLMDFIVADSEFFSLLESVIQLMALNFIFNRIEITIAIIVLEFMICLRPNNSEDKITIND